MKEKQNNLPHSYNISKCFKQNFECYLQRWIQSGCHTIMKKELVKKDAMASNVASQQEGPLAYYQPGHGSAWSLILAHCQPLVLFIVCYKGGSRTRSSVSCLSMFDPLKPSWTSTELDAIHDIRSVKQLRHLNSKCAK